MGKGIRKVEQKADEKDGSGGLTKQETGELMLLLSQATLRKDADPKHVETLRRLFKENPITDWNQGVARLALEGTLNAARYSPGAAEATRAGIDALQRGLGYEAAPALERLLIEHIGLCWASYQGTHFEYTCAVALELTLDLAEYWERRLSTVQRRYLRALESLAKVRRMKLPPIQVNVGDKQINIAGGALPGA